jgi:hypothetical protein
MKVSYPADPRGSTDHRLGNTGLEDVGASTSHNTMGFHGLLQGQLYLTFFNPRIVPQLGYDHFHPDLL